MNIKEIVDKGLDLEQKRRTQPYDEKGFSQNFDSANKEYLEFLRLHGNLILTHLKETSKG